MKKIGMIAAMLVESEKVVDWLGNPIKTDLYGSFSVKSFIKNDCEIYLINSGVGEILASSATQLLISLYKVDLIINFGLCGSLVDFDLSEMCILEGVVHYDFDLSSLDPVKRGRYERFPSCVIKTDEKLVEICSKINPSIKKVICASGDKFIADENVKKDLNAEFGVHVCEMESAGILITSLHNGVPALFIKVVSDTKDHKEEFSTFVERNNFEFVSILDKLTKELA